MSTLNVTATSSFTGGGGVSQASQALKQTTSRINSSPEVNSTTRFTYVSSPSIVDNVHALSASVSNDSLPSHPPLLNLYS